MPVPVLVMAAPLTGPLKVRLEVRVFSATVVAEPRTSGAEMAWVLPSTATEVVAPPLRVSVAGKVVTESFCELWMSIGVAAAKTSPAKVRSLVPRSAVGVTTSGKPKISVSPLVGTVASGATLAIRADATAATWQSADIDALFAVSPFVSGSKLGVEVPAASFAYNTDIDGAQGLTKLGGGTFSLGGTSGYNGPTTVSAGTLHVAGTVYGTSSVTVTAAGALTVNGELSTTTLNTAGTTNLAADSTGTIATMNVTGGSTTVSAPTVMTLKPSAGTTTLGVEAQEVIP